MSRTVVDKEQELRGRLPRFVGALVVAFVTSMPGIAPRSAYVASLHARRNLQAAGRDARCPGVGGQFGTCPGCGGSDRQAQEPHLRPPSDQHARC